jgi:hypothetical protein
MRDPRGRTSAGTGARRLRKCGGRAPDGSEVEELLALVAKEVGKETAEEAVTLGERLIWAERVLTAASLADLLAD